MKIGFTFTDKEMIIIQGGKEIRLTEEQQKIVSHALWLKYEKKKWEAL